MTKKSLLSVVFLLVILLPFILIFGREVLSTNPDNRYRASGTSSTAHEIGIDDYYSVQSMPASFSVLQYDNEEIHIEFADSIVKLNWNNDYIIASSKKDDLDVYSDVYYLIVNRGTREVVEYDSLEQFEKEIKAKNINLELERKVAFDWY